MTATKTNQVYLYYLLAMFVISVTDIRSQYFYVSYSFTETFSVLVLIFLSVSLLRRYLEPVVVNRKNKLDQPKQQFAFDLSLFVLAALLLFLFEIHLFKHSYIAASKLISIILVIGYFASMDNALNREKTYFKLQTNIPEQINHTIPVSRRLSLFLTITLLIVLLVNTISAYYYMTLNLNDPNLSVEELKKAYLIETIFILGVIIALTLRLIHTYSLNLQYLFDTQVNALHHIQDGKLDLYVPVLSRDEFGIIAQQTNRVINELREKQKIQKTLERIVSPDVMQKLIHPDSHNLKHGERKNVAVFFCDLRKYTLYAEKTPAEDVIFFLNAYFTKIVDIVSEHNGVVNKFMGDAILAVFPLEDNIATIDNAVETAWDIIEHSQAIRLANNERFNIGIGIHTGYATAGTIGSHERFEYTFIGDTVNTASRLDGLTKRLNYNLVISAETYNQLSPMLQLKFDDLGIQKIRGKNTPIHVYGASPFISNNKEAEEDRRN